MTLGQGELRPVKLSPWGGEEDKMERDTYLGHPELLGKIVGNRIRNGNVMLLENSNKTIIFC